MDSSWSIGSFDEKYHQLFVKIFYEYNVYTAPLILSGTLQVNCPE